MTSPQEKAQLRQQYEATAEALACIRAREIAAMTDAEALRQIHALRCVGTPYRERPNWSGLVIQQALFQKAMKR